MSSKGILASAFVVFLANAITAPAKTPKQGVVHPPIIWRNPSNIATQDLFYGPGGSAHVPRGPFTFIKEDLDGTNPKIIVKDPQGIRWTVKLGAEAKPETAASRIVWGAGYFANEDYFLSEAKVLNLPAKLHRIPEDARVDGVVYDVRLKRHDPGERKTGNWAWADNPFKDTRELNGLRVLMSLLNNWDLTDENNAIYEQSDGAYKGSPVFMVSDLGSTFGNGKLSWPMKLCRGNLEAYSGSRFITHATSDYVDLHAPAGASLFFLATPGEFHAKAHLRWIGHQIPTSDARWLGAVMARIPPEHIRDAFRAAGYSPREVEGFTAVVESRIRELQRL